MALDPSSLQYPYRLEPPLAISSPEITTAFLDPSPVLLGIVPYERQLIRALLEFSTSQQLIDGIFLLEATELSLVSSLIEIALFEFRGKGSRSVHADERKRKKNKFTTHEEKNNEENLSDLPVSTPAPPASTPSKSAGENSDKSSRVSVLFSNFSPVLSKLGIKRPLPILKKHSKQSKAKRPVRKSSFVDGVKTRSEQLCLVSGISCNDTLLECCHIIPHHISAVPADYSMETAAYWAFLSLLIGEDTRDLIYDVIGEEDSPENGILLNASMHSHFDNGDIRFEAFPTTGSADERYSRVRTGSYILNFHWRGTASGLELMNSCRPKNTNLQTELVNGFLQFKSSAFRPIESGERFMLYTKFEDIPLPFPLLFAVHSRLWSIIEAGGLWSTVKRLDEKIQKFLNSKDTQDEEGYDDNFPYREDRPRTRTYYRRVPEDRVYTAKDANAGGSGQERCIEEGDACTIEGDIADMSFGSSSSKGSSHNSGSDKSAESETGKMSSSVFSTTSTVSSNMCWSGNLLCRSSQGLTAENRDIKNPQLCLEVIRETPVTDEQTSKDEQRTSTDFASHENMQNEDSSTGSDCEDEEYYDGSKDEEEVFSEIQTRKERAVGKFEEALNNLIDRRR